MARHKNSWNVFLMIFVMHVLNANAFDVENCPGECHCDMDGLLMVVDCSGLALSELPEFPDNQVKKYLILKPIAPFFYECYFRFICSIYRTMISRQFHRS